MFDSNHLQDFGRRYADAWGSQNPGSVAAFFSSNGSLRVNDEDPAVGREAIATVALGFMVAFPDMKVVMDNLVVKGAGAIFCWTLTGTNTGPAGTGRAVRISGFEEWRFDREGLIAESLGHFDADDYNRQLEG